MSMRTRAKLAITALAAAVVIWLLRRGSTPVPEQAAAPPPAPAPPPSPAAPAVEGYCVKERKKVAIKDPEKAVTKNGREAVRGTCPDCGTTVFRFV
jgi:hypothetical protein